MNTIINDSIITTNLPSFSSSSSAFSSSSSSSASFPKLGVSIEFLKYFSKFILNNNQTTTEICELIIKPQTINSNQSYIEYLITNENLNNELFFGNSTYFISHAWKFSILQLFSSIEIFHNSLSKEEKDNNKIFYWIDLFVIDQHNAPNRPHNWWSTVFIDAIRSFHNIVLVFIPFLDPIPLHRAWCLWELYSSIIVDANIHITMPAEQWIEFRTKIQNDYTIVGNVITNLDVHLAEAFNPKDREEIFETIQSTCGFEHINNLIRQKILGILLCGAVRETIKDHNIDRVKYFLDAGGDINTIATFYTPLGIVAELNDHELLQLLISYGADLNKTMIDGNTALHLAAKNGHVDICTILLKQGADYNIRNNAGKTPFDEVQDVIIQYNHFEENNQSQSLLLPSTTILDELKVKAIVSSENAMNELNHLKRSELSELKAMMNAPPIFLLIFQYLSRFLGLFDKKEQWNRIVGTIVLRASIISDTVSYLNRIMNNEIQLSNQLYEEYQQSELYSFTQEKYNRLPNSIKCFYLFLISVVNWYEYYQQLSNQKNISENINNTKEENSGVISNEMIDFNIFAFHSKENSQNYEILYKNCKKCISVFNNEMRKEE